MSVGSTRPDVVVLGAGVIGLTTAWRLREQGLHVEIWSREPSLATTSARAGAIWYPFLAKPRDRVLAWSRTTYERLVELAAEPDSGVHVHPVVEVFATEEPDLWWQEAVPNVERLADADVPAPHRAAVRIDAPVCDIPVHLPWLVDEVRGLGVAFVERAVASLDECFERADRVVNCTGLGAAELCDDDEVVPVRGQIVLGERVPLPHAWVDDTTPIPRYIVPRRDGLVLGGTAQHGDRSLEPRSADSETILAALGGSFPELRDVRVQKATVGLRPYRSTVRLQREPHPAGVLVHNYGHGGSGYTMAWGCADEVVALVTGAS